MAKNENKKIANGYLTSALDIEDRMSLEVYGELLDQKAWPADLDKEVFENIKRFLNIVIEETEMHKKVFLDLQKKLSDNSDN